jgi:type II secretory pathway predicted ATPase ExeA
MITSSRASNRSQLVRWVLQALSQTTRHWASSVELFHQFQDYLITEYGSGRRVVLVFDEAQNLNRESLEELRMFTNINTNKDELLQLILVGQPELRDRVRQPDLTQFAQRIAASFHITEMDEDTVRAYIAHRLRVAGASAMLFDDAACALIYRATGGVPRLVNQLCDLGMVYTYADNCRPVTETVIRQILADGVFFGGGVLVLRDPIET